MKVIDLLNKIANGEEVPKKIGALNDIWTFEEGFGKYKNKAFRDLVKVLMGEYTGQASGLVVKAALNYEVEILEDKTEEIEEIEVDDNNYIHTELGSFKGRKMDIAFVNKFNELTKIVNKLNKQDTSKETNCMTD